MTSLICGVVSDSGMKVPGVFLQIRIVDQEQSHCGLKAKFSGKLALQVALTMIFWYSVRVSG